MRGETKHKETIANMEKSRKQHILVQSSAGMMPSPRVVDTVINYIHLFHSSENSLLTLLCTQNWSHLWNYIIHFNNLNTISMPWD